MYGLKRKNFKYKSKYFKRDLNYYEFTQRGIKEEKESELEKAFFFRLRD